MLTPDFGLLQGPALAKAALAASRAAWTHAAHLAAQAALGTSLPFPPITSTTFPASRVPPAASLARLAHVSNTLPLLPTSDVSVPPIVC
jgi:hypothetical protein